MNPNSVWRIYASPHSGKWWLFVGWWLWAFLFYVWAFWWIFLLIIFSAESLTNRFFANSPAKSLVKFAIVIIIISTIVLCGAIAALLAPNPENPPVPDGTSKEDSLHVTDSLPHDESESLPGDPIAIDDIGFLSSTPSQINMEINEEYSDTLDVKASVLIDNTVRDMIAIVVDEPNVINVSWDNSDNLPHCCRFVITAVSDGIAHLFFQTFDESQKTSVITITVKKAETTAIPTTPADTKVPEKTDPPYVEPVRYTYVLNTSSKKFHEEYCNHASKISSKNKKYYEGSRDDLISMGYTPCGTCDP
jgi:hypothetical protein